VNTAMTIELDISSKSISRQPLLRSKGTFSLGS